MGVRFSACKISCIGLAAYEKGKARDRPLRRPDLGANYPGDQNPTDRGGLAPYAGPPLGYRSKTAAYDAARKGFIRTIPQGRKCPVPTPWLRQVLGLDETRRRRDRPGKRKKAADSASATEAATA
jgi:hypothetical protein